MPIYDMKNGAAHSHAILKLGDAEANGEPRSGKETRPVNMSVFWIMHVEKLSVPHLSPIGRVIAESG
jgi:hypothetical protein